MLTFGMPSTDYNIYFIVVTPIRMILLLQCLVSENINTPTTEGIGNSWVSSLSRLKIGAGCRLNLAGNILTITGCFW